MTDVKNAKCRSDEASIAGREEEFELDLTPEPETIGELNLWDEDAEDSLPKPHTENDNTPSECCVAIMRPSNQEKDKCPNGPVEPNDKLPRRKRIKSPYRDAKFLQDLESFNTRKAQKGASDRARMPFSAAPPLLLPTPTTHCEHSTSAVNSTSASVDGDPLGELTANEIDAILEQLEGENAHKNAIASKRPQKTYARFKQRTVWWRKEYATHPATLDEGWLHKHHVPAPWRDTSDILRATYYHRAMKELGYVPAGFTLRLRKDVEKLARQQPDPLNWLQERISRNVGKVLNRSGSFYVNGEETDDLHRQLHVHGEIGLCPYEASNKRLLVKVRRALRQSGGQWPYGRQFQANIIPDVNEGWASYAAKEFWKFMPNTRRMFDRFPNRIGPGFRGKQLSVTVDLRRRAQALYDDDRDVVIAWRQCNVAKRTIM